MEKLVHTQRGLCFIFVFLISLDVLRINCIICMTWDIVNSHIKLNCKTDNLQFKVLFFDAIEREYAFCFISFPKSICQAHFTQCEISQNLLTNETQLTIPLNNENGNSKWTCRHGYNYEEATVHVQLDEKHDIITPEIRTKQTWPFEDGSVVELTCLARINSQAASLNWDCTDIETSTHNVVNCTHYSTKLIYTATVKDNGRVCKCIATMGTASTSTSIKLEIRKIFSLDIYHQFECNNSEEVQLSCTISSNALSFGFDSWIHTYKGVFIRHVKGTNLGNKSVLLINTCQFYDCGKYTCRAWERGENGLKWIQEGGELKVRGPPFVVDTYTVSTPVLAFAVKFVSQPTAYFLEWYTSDDVVNSSSKYNQTTTNDTFTVFMHGVPVAVAGYRATLTIRSKEEMETDEQVSLVLINELGKTSYSFKLWIDRKVFNFQIVQWTLVVITVLILTVMTALLARQSKTRKGSHLPQNPSIYFAAPFEETEPNIYNDIIADNEEIMSIREHHNLDI